MLELIDIKKEYVVGDDKVEALKGVNLEFRKNEFVSILGPSGCGKTTLLNIVGGLDRYTTGDLKINGKSTKDFKENDWNAYRNHSIGFVFQSYNLIPHQSVLENVELALTLSGVSKKERRKRATEVLIKVGLGDKLKNRPNQLSGGQMQRVAIARALVNDPEIILADEPTGALDSTTSVQIMEILKEISKDKLIIMVTHNPELANKYSTRIVRLLDGELTDDSNPYNSQEDVSINNSQKVIVEKKDKKRMSFFTALSLSFKNLLTKKTRTILVAFAGSIGIIGIALILAISSGFNTYVNTMQKNTLSTYPLQITNSSYDMASLMQIILDNKSQSSHENDKIYTKNELTDMLSKFNASSSKNDLKSFKEYIDGEGKEELEKYTSVIQYIYNAGINAYYESADNGLISANATTIFSDIITAYPYTHPLDTQDKQLRYGMLNMLFGSSSSFYSNEFWSEMLTNQDLLSEQYELVGEGSRWASEYNEIMIVLDENNEISDYTLYGLGMLKQSDLETLLDKYIDPDKYDGDSTALSSATFEYEDILGLEYKIILEADYFEEIEGEYVDIRTLPKQEYATKLQALYSSDKAITMKVAGIIKEKENVTSHSINTVIGYTSKLTQYIINQNNQHPLISAQLLNNTTNVLTGEAFNLDTVAQEKNMVLYKLGYADLSSPEGIYLYPINFEAKENINKFIESYNAKCIKAGQDGKVITFSDAIGEMMSSISTIISAISYVLIAFVGVSLIVSSIMIGIITYISVIERTKEIGVLRSVGASKKDVKRVFTAESFIIGLASGLFGIFISLLLIIPINILLKHFTQIAGIATLPVLGAIILVCISVTLTFIAGLIPAHIASKKDPVLALRTE